MRDPEMKQTRKRKNLGKGLPRAQAGLRSQIAHIPAPFAASLSAGMEEPSENTVIAWVH